MFKSFKLLSVFCSVLVSSQVILADDRPNVLFILCDDLGYGDVGVFYQNSRGSKDASFTTPHIDKLANEGIQLRAHYVGAPVCAPSRATLILGQSQGNSPVRNNQFDKELPNQPTMASTLQDAGYHTGLIGKWGMQGKKDKSKVGADAWPSYPTKRGFDYFLGYVAHVDGHEHYPFENIHFKHKKKNGKAFRKAQLWEQDEEISAKLKGCYTTDLFTAASKRFLVSHFKKSPQKPSFLMLSYDTPHAAAQIATMAYPSGFGVKGGIQWLGQNGKMINTASGSADSYIHPDYVKKDWQDVYKRYASSVRRIDNSVEDVMQTLKDLKVDENTLVVFSSDHGPSKESYIKEQIKPEFFRSFGPFTGIKRDVWEGGIRPGAIVRWPAKVKAGLVSESPSQMQDWMPTFCDVADTGTPAIADGVSLAPVLKGDDGVGSEIYVEYYNNGKTPTNEYFAKDKVGKKRGEMQAIRQGNWKAIRYDVKSADDLFMVFDVVNDPSESINIAGNPSVPSQQHWLDAVSRHHHKNPSAKRPYDGVEIAALDLEASPGVKVTLARGEKSDYVSRDSYQLSGYIKVDKSGKYTFGMLEGVKGLLKIHRINVLDTDSKQQYPNDHTLNLEAGYHPYTLYLKDMVDSAEVLLWKAKGGSDFEVIPAAHFFQ